MRTIHRHIVGAIILDSQGNILLGRKDPSQGGVYSDCWHAPGGGIEEGEDLLDALKRELLEEVGLSITSEEARLLDDTGSADAERTLSSGELVLARMKFTMFEVALDDVKRNTVKPTNELIEIQWFPKSSLAYISLTPPGRELFRRLGWIGNG